VGNLSDVAWRAGKHTQSTGVVWEREGSGIGTGAWDRAVFVNLSGGGVGSGVRGVVVLDRRCVGSGVVRGCGMVRGMAV